jgi:hypothetical protein
VYRLPLPLPRLHLQLTGPDLPYPRGPAMPLINPETGSEIDVEADGDFTVTFSMTLPPQPTEPDES